MTSTTHVINDHVLLIPQEVEVMIMSDFPGAYDYLLYNDWEINTMENGKFTVIDCNDWEIFTTLDEAMAFIDSRAQLPWHKQYWQQA